MTHAHYTVAAKGIANSDRIAYIIATKVLNLKSINNEILQITSFFVRCARSISDSIYSRSVLSYKRYSERHSDQ